MSCFFLNRQLWNSGTSLYYIRLPGESPETVEETIHLLRKIAPLVTLFHILTLFPGTHLYDLYQSGTGATDDIWLSRYEDLLFFEVDTNLPEEAVSQFGKRLKQQLLQSIPDFFHSIELVDDKELFPFHARFLSRLALTLDRGDYPFSLPRCTTQELARELYEKALGYSPHAEIYWGLGLLAMDEKDYWKAEKILQEGLQAFPEDDILPKVLANTLMRIGQEHKARKLMQNLQKKLPH